MSPISCLIFCTAKYIRLLNKAVLMLRYVILNQVVNSQGASKTSFPYFPFIAYAPSGVAEGELVFCNQGSEHNFQLLDSKNISVKNKIVLIRGYGASVRNLVVIYFFYFPGVIFKSITSAPFPQFCLRGEGCGCTVVPQNNEGPRDWKN